MPLSARASGPLDPSPGKGPAVSSGISVDGGPDDVSGVVEANAPPLRASSPTLATPAPAPIMVSTRRRLTTVPRSKTRPWS